MIVGLMSTRSKDSSTGKIKKHWRCSSSSRMVVIFVEREKYQSKSRHSFIFKGIKSTSQLTMKIIQSNLLFFYSFERPNVCSKIETRSISKLIPCVKSYDHLVKVWSHNCTNGRRVCPVYEHRFVSLFPRLVSLNFI